ncbi:MAG: hypothetical protein U5N55_00080 [Cypionkella sp.]|nr:hypothetical protein [Cypionkella sp.]
MLIGIALVGLLTSRDVEKYGDTYQIALPLLVLGCEALNGSRPWPIWGALR